MSVCCKLILQSRISVHQSAGCLEHSYTMATRQTLTWVYLIQGISETRLISHCSHGIGLLLLASCGEMIRHSIKLPLIQGVHQWNRGSTQRQNKYGSLLEVCDQAGDGMEGWMDQVSIHKGYICLFMTIGNQRIISFHLASPATLSPRKQVPLVLPHQDPDLSMANMSLWTMV